MEYLSELHETVKKICTPGKGILAADESTGTIGKRLATISLKNSIFGKTAADQRKCTRKSACGCNAVNIFLFLRKNVIKI